MFAYCGNDPLIRSDPFGSRFDSTFNQFKACYADSSGYQEEQQETLEYNGVEVVILPFLGDSAFSLGKIYVGPNVANDEKLLAHEYGHCIQMEEIGIVKYLHFVALPSVTYWFLTQLEIVPVSDYYNRPWECLADMYGGVSRNHAEGAEDAALSYWEYVKEIEYPIFPIY